MWSDRRLLALFKTDHPIVLAPIAGRCPDYRTAGDVDLRALDWRHVVAK
jgi:hypothetical protein